VLQFQMDKNLVLPVFLMQLLAVLLPQRILISANAILMESLALTVSELKIQLAIIKSLDCTNFLLVLD
jgi:hypothetical protein